MEPAHGRPLVVGGPSSVQLAVTLLQNERFRVPAIPDLGRLDIEMSVDTDRFLVRVRAKFTWRILYE